MKKSFWTKEMWYNLIQNWSSDRVSVWAAALSFYALFSLVPFVYLVVFLISLVLQTPNAQDSVYTFIEVAFNTTVSHTIRQAVAGISLHRDSAYLTAVSFGTLLLGVTSMYLHVHAAINHIWRQNQPISMSLRRHLTQRLMALILVVPSVMLLFITFLVTAVLSALKSYVGNVVLVDFAASVILISFLMGMTYITLARRSYPLKHIIISAVVSGVLFTVGKMAVNVYTNQATLPVAFGATLIWIYFSAHVFLFGAELIKALASNH